MTDEANKRAIAHIARLARWLKTVDELGERGTVVSCCDDCDLYRWHADGQQQCLAGGTPLRGITAPADCPLRQGDYTIRLWVDDEEHAG